MNRSENHLQPDRLESEEMRVSFMEIRQARTRAAISIGLNLSLALGKGIAGVMSHSSALLGDALHSATDVLASAAAFIGLWLAGKQHPAFPYGLYKAETIAMLITSAAVILAGYEIGRQAVLGPNILPNVALALPVALISLFVTFGFGFYQLRSGRRLHSKALEADARDYLADGLSTLVVVISLMGAYFGLHLDRWAAGIVAIFIFWAGGQLLWQALRGLMDEAIDRETERKIIGLLESHPRVESVERCLSRMAGGRFIIDIDVVLRSESHDLAHRISHCLENEVCRHFPRVVMVRVKTHSPQSHHLLRITPVQYQEGPLEARLAKSPWFLLETIDRNTCEISTREYLRNPYRESDTKRGCLVGKWLLDFKPDQVVVAHENEGTAAILLREAGVELVLAGNPLTGKEKL